MPFLFEYELMRGEACTDIDDGDLYDYYMFEKKGEGCFLNSAAADL